MMSRVQAFNLSHTTTNLLIDLAIGRRERPGWGGRVRDRGMTLQKKYIRMGWRTLSGWTLTVVRRPSSRAHASSVTAGRLRKHFNVLTEAFRHSVVWGVLHFSTCKTLRWLLLCCQAVVILSPFISDFKRSSGFSCWEIFWFGAIK